jgi:hypothetical protein
LKVLFAQRHQDLGARTRIFLSSMRKKDKNGLHKFTQQFFLLILYYALGGVCVPKVGDAVAEWIGIPAH